MLEILFLFLPLPALIVEMGNGQLKTYDNYANNNSIYYISDSGLITLKYLSFWCFFLFITGTGF